MFIYTYISDLGKKKTCTFKGCCIQGAVQIFYSRLHCCRKGIWQKQPKRLQRRRTALLFFGRIGRFLFEDVGVAAHVKSIPRDLAARNFKVVMFIHWIVCLRGWFSQTLQDFTSPVLTFSARHWIATKVLVVSHILLCSSLCGEMIQFD